MPHIAFRLDDESAKQLEHVLGVDGVTLSSFARRAICAAIAERLPTPGALPARTSALTSPLVCTPSTIRNPMSLSDDERLALEMRCVDCIAAILDPARLENGTPLPKEFADFDIQEAEKLLATERQIALAASPRPAGEPDEDHEFQSTAAGVQKRANELVANGITDLSAICQLMNVNRRHASVLVSRGRKAKKAAKKNPK